MTSRAGLIVLLALGALVHCDGSRESAPSRSGARPGSTPTSIGTGGAGGTDEPAAGAAGASGGAPQGEGEGGVAGDGNPPDGPQGQGGEAPVTPEIEREVVELTEQGLDPDLIVTDPELLDGKSFVLPEGLCPTNEPWEDWSYLDGYSRFDASPLRNLHVIRQGDSLELVSSTPTRTSPLIQRVTLERTSSGFRATDLVVCTDTVYKFEDTYRIASYEAPLAHLVFTSGESPDEIEVTLGAWLDVDEETAVRSGGLDHVPPTIHRLSVPGEQLYAHDGGWDPVTPGGVDPPYYYFFDEPVLDGELSLDDGLGNPVTISKQTSNGFLVGFWVKAFVQGKPPLNLGVTDLAGNAWVSGPTFPGITLHAVGDIESDDDYIESAEAYGAHSAGTLTELGDDGWLGDFSVPPLSGASSLLVRNSAVYLRVARSPGATSLGFSVRAIEAEHTELSVQIQALDDGSKSSWTYDQDPETLGSDTAWLEDPVYAEALEFVSLPEELSAPLPETGDDLLVRVDVGGMLWLDSLVTE